MQYIGLSRPSYCKDRPAGSSIYELGKANVLALQSDAELLTEAFSELQRKVRPRLRREAPRLDEDDDRAVGAADEPLLVVEGGLRTDSSARYPVYTPEP